VEFEGALYHVITRGNNRQAVFQDDEDYWKFLSLLQREKQRHLFYLYALVLMTNHVHLLVERQTDSLSGTMQRVLTGYAQSWNRKHRRVGHVFQGRYKAILCQPAGYLSELVRYIHLNPVRAKMVRRPEDYRWSSHRAYLGLERWPWVDTEIVLRHFHARRRRAVQEYEAFVQAGMKQGHRPEFYAVEDGRFLGSEEFAREVKHRMGEASPMIWKRKKEFWAWSEVVAQVEAATGLALKEIQGRGRAAEQMTAKEVLIYVGRERGGVSVRELGERLGVDPSNVTRGYERARQRVQTDQEFRLLVSQVLAEEIRNTQA
jgi:REP element-mobilizing transposase RayT